MNKCEQCGKEVLFPFTCTYCGKEYCDEHRLPESHECSNMPKEPPPYISPIAPEDKTPRVGLCPKCHFAQSDMTDYDAETITFKCRRCGFKYSQLKASPHDYVEPKDKTEFREKPKVRMHFPIKKAIGAVLAVIIIGALIWYAPPIISYITSHLPSQNNAQPNWNTETFQLVQASLLAPVMISRHFEVQSGNHLVGNFQFSNLPSSNYEIGVAILDPLQGTLQVFINKTSGSFDITASISGAYEMNFGFTCAQQVTAPSVTLNTRIVR